MMKKPGAERKTSAKFQPAYLLVVFGGDSTGVVGLSDGGLETSLLFESSQSPRPL